MKIVIVPMNPFWTRLDIREVYCVIAGLLLVFNSTKQEILRNGTHIRWFRDCVADLLAHGVELDNISAADFDGGPVTRISQTVRAKEIYNNACSVHSIDSGNSVVILFLNEWSDGFEPHYSIKGNCGSSWIKMVNICPPPGKIHSLTHMHPIAVGKANVSHEEVESQFAEELRCFGSGSAQTFYSGMFKKTLLCTLNCLFVSLMDQPEQQSANYVMLGTSNYTTRWGHAGDFASVASGIPACCACLAVLLSSPGGFSV